MTEILCSSPLVRGTEFFLDDNGVRLFGTCGERALASAASSVLGTDVNPLGIYDSMRAHGWADPGGASTIGGLLAQAKLMNLPIAAFQSYGEPWSGWSQWLDLWVTIAGDPAVVEVANGQALVDSISGQGENAVNLQYHYIAVLGRNQGGFSPRAGRVLPAGWWCADGDSFAGGNSNANGFNALNVLQFYTDGVLAAARPCAALALQGKAIKMAWTVQPDGGGLDQATPQHHVGAGIMSEITAAGLAAFDGLMSETRMPEPFNYAFVPLNNGDVVTWYFDKNTAAHDQGAEVLSNVWGLYQAALKQAATPPVVPVTLPAPAPVSQATQLAIDAVAALQAALAAR